MAASETIRVRIDPETKKALTKLYEAKGTTVSQAIRSFLAEELKETTSVVERFDALMASAHEKIDALDKPAPTLDEINTYIDKVRTERYEDAQLRAC